MGNNLTHLDSKGKASMVDVGEKNITDRTAVATGLVKMKPETLALIGENKIQKGDVLSVARVAGIQGGKKTPDLIPLCHSLPIDKIAVEFKVDAKRSGIVIKATAKYRGKTGVEMEALSAVSVAALTIYDMCKAVDKEIVISDIMLEYKEGGKSGMFQRKDKK